MKIRQGAFALVTVSIMSPVFADPSAETEPKVTEENNQPELGPELIAEDAVRSSAVTGVSVPLTVLSFGAIVAAPVSP